MARPGLRAAAPVTYAPRRANMPTCRHFPTNAPAFPAISARPAKPRGAACARHPRRDAPTSLPIPAKSRRADRGGGEQRGGRRARVMHPSVSGPGEGLDDGARGRGGGGEQRGGRRARVLHPSVSRPARGWTTGRAGRGGGASSAGADGQGYCTRLFGPRRGAGRRGARTARGGRAARRQAGKGIAPVLFRAPARGWTTGRADSARRGLPPASTPRCADLPPHTREIAAGADAAAGEQRGGRRARAACTRLFRAPARGWTTGRARAAGRHTASAGGAAEGVWERAQRGVRARRAGAPLPAPPCLLPPAPPALPFSQRFPPRPRPSPGTPLPFAPPAAKIARGLFTRAQLCYTNAKYGPRAPRARASRTEREFPC